MREHPLLFATALWFCHFGVCDTVSIENEFADGSGMLPGYLPLVAIHSYDWRARIAIPPSIFARLLPSDSSRTLRAIHVHCLRPTRITTDRRSYTCQLFL